MHKKLNSEQKKTLQFPSHLTGFLLNKNSSQKLIIKLQSAQESKQMAHLFNRCDLLQVNNSVLYYIEIRSTEKHV